MRGLIFGKRLMIFGNCIKMLGGLNYNSYVNNTPKDLVVDRVQVIRYPENTGHTGPIFMIQLTKELLLVFI